MDPPTPPKPRQPKRQTGEGPSGSRPPPPGPPALKDLPEFLDAIWALLRKIIFEWDELMIAQERRQVMKEAFNELDNKFHAIKLGLVDFDTKKFADAGLDGKQLEMKLSKGRNLWRSFWKRGGRKWLGRVLTWSNKLLESLATVLPGGHAIKELKDACEDELSDTA
jgi:hypothetical protein